MGAINAYQLLQRQGSIGGSWMDGPDALELPNRQPKSAGDRKITRRTKTISTNTAC